MAERKVSRMSVAGRGASAKESKYNRLDKTYIQKNESQFKHFFEFIRKIITYKKILYSFPAPKFNRKNKGKYQKKDKY